MQDFEAKPLTKGTEAVVLSAFFILSLAGTFLVFSPILSSPLGPIDDHEYLKYAFFNPTGDLTLGLRQGLERGWEEFTAEGRVRPVYQMGRTVTTSIVADNAFVRYLFRLLIATFFINAIVLSTVKRSDFSQSHHLKRALLWLSCTVALIAYLPWLDVVGRLGPPDILGIFGISLAIGVMSFRPCRPHKLWGPSTKLIYFCGLTIAAGSRENYAIYASVVAISTLFFFCRSNLPLGLATKIGLVFYSIFPITSVIAISNRGGKDFYGRSRTLANSVEMVLDFLSSELFLRLCPLVLLWWFLSLPFERLRIAYVSNIAFAIMSVDYLQYSTSLVTYGRYRFISDLFFVGVIVGICRAALMLPDRFRSSCKLRRTLAITTITGVTTFCAISIPGVERTSNQFEYATRLNTGFTLLVRGLVDSFEASSSDSLLIFTDTQSTEYHALDLQERSLGLYWFLRFSLPSLTKVERLNIDDPAINAGSAPFCLFLGMTPPPIASSQWHCKESIRIF